MDRGAGQGQPKMTMRANWFRPVTFLPLSLNVAVPLGLAVMPSLP